MSETRETEWISKKELLAITGISYGQLYRWKRERLIPDSWFVKRSAVTGQETFLPRERILERIRFIQEMRDTCPLNRMQELLNPGAESRSYSPEELSAFPSAALEIGLQRGIAGTEDLASGQVVCALLTARLRRNAGLSEEYAGPLLRKINLGYERGYITKPGMLLLVCEDRGRLHLVFFKGEDQAAAVIFDGDAGRFWLSHLDDHIPQIMNALRTIAGRNA